MKKMKEINWSGNFIECYDVEEANTVPQDKYTFVAYDKGKHCYVFKLRQKYMKDAK